MKNKLLFLVICLSFFISSVFADNNITFKEELSLPGIKDIISYDNGYYVLNDNQVITKYTIDNQEITNKTIENINIQSISKINNNILLIGEKDNLLNIQLLDDNLRVIKNYQTDILLNSANAKSYTYESNTYIILSIEGIISNNKIVIIDENMEYTTKSISELENLEQIIKSDYYYYNNDNPQVIVTNSSTLNDKKYLIGYKQEDENINGFIKEIDNNQIVQIEGYKAIDIKSVDNYLAVLLTNDTDNKLIVYDETLHKINELTIEDKVFKLSRIHNNIAVICENKIVLYNYTINAKIAKSLFGEINLVGDIKAYNEITVEVTPNSGYEINKINVQTLSGQRINTHNNKFIMPEESIKISVDYDEVVTNPETIDPIFLVVILSMIMLIIIKELYTEYKWLK